MTLLNAPEFDHVRERRYLMIRWTGAAVLVVLFVGFFFAAGRPVDWPWFWMSHLCGRMAVNAFFEDLEKNDLGAAYAVWTHDPEWRQHAEKHEVYPFARFEKDWAADSQDNDYGAFQSHRIAAARMMGNVLRTGTFVNGRKSKAINLDYDPREHTLSFSPDDSQFLEGSGGIR